MKFTLQIESDNDSMVGEDAHMEIARLLICVVAADVEEGCTSGYLRDINNGDRIGSWSYEPQKETDQ